jgi:Protein of unknown function (DUF3617)
MSRTFLLVGAFCAFTVCFASAFGSSHSASIDPGEYHTTITITSLTGLPDQVAQGIMGAPKSGDDCIATSDLNELLHDQLAVGEDMTCSENKSTATSGRLSGTATCHDTEGASGTMRFKGTYTSTHIEVTADMAGTFTMGPITEKIHIVSDRTGACSGGSGN